MNGTTLLAVVVPELLMAQVANGSKDIQAIAPTSEQPEPSMVGEDAPRVQCEGARVGARRDLKADKNPSLAPGIDLEDRRRP